MSQAELAAEYEKKMQELDAVRYVEMEALRKQFADNVTKRMASLEADHAALAADHDKKIADRDAKVKALQTELATAVQAVTTQS
jgi:hypothetical protein